VSLDTRSVLVVDDDPYIRDALADVLADEGYEVTAARDGEEALEILRASLRPAVILLDLRMPGMSGWEVRKRLLADPELSAIPVVLLSADAHLEDAAATLRAAGSLRKPPSLDELLEAVGRHAAAA
jgi:CheY-like chemotaxis protein